MLENVNHRYYEAIGVAEQYGKDCDVIGAEEVILDFLRNDARRESVLELGIGGGRTTPHLLAITKDYVGVDYSKRMVETCRQKFDSIFMVCDARNMPSFENERFSAVVFWGNGIDEVSPLDRILILHEVNRVLKKDGLFTFSSHNLDWHGVPAFALEGFSLSVGQLMTRLTSDVDSLNELLSSGIVTVLSQAAVALYVAIWMVRINRPLALSILLHSIRNYGLRCLVSKNSQARFPQFPREDCRAQCFFAGAFDWHADNPDLHPRGP